MIVWYDAELDPPGENMDGVKVLVVKGDRNGQKEIDTGRHWTGCAPEWTLTCTIAPVIWWTPLPKMPKSEKEQQISARLLSADEIALLPRTSIVWIEFFNAEEGKAESIKAAMKCADGTLIDEDTCVFDDFEKDMKQSDDGYWRFWLG